MEKNVWMKVKVKQCHVKKTKKKDTRKKRCSFDVFMYVEEFVCEKILVMKCLQV